MKLNAQPCVYGVFFLQSKYASISPGATEVADESIFEAPQFPILVNFDSLDEVLAKGASKGQNGQQ